ncbi:MAG TPA: AAA family ATPase, partial [Pirellulales bacterium]|nr:AAA family ATPase [Pirellulales bacterium]
MKPTAAQNSLREFGDAFPGDELDDADTDFGATNINAAAGHSEEVRDAVDEPIGDEPKLGNDEADTNKVYWHGEVDFRKSRPHLVQDCIPEVGHGLIAGQWGTFKTFGTFDLAHSIMSGEPWLGYEIMRRGGVLFIALEG